MLKGQSFLHALLPPKSYLIILISPARIYLRWFHLSLLTLILERGGTAPLLMATLPIF